MSPAPNKPGFFDQAFAGYAPCPCLRRLAEAFCRTYCIEDEDAPVYVATLAALELGMGDGGERFWELEGEPAAPAIEKLACKLMHHFWSVIRVTAPRTTLDDIALVAVGALQQR